MAFRFSIIFLPALAALFAAPVISASDFCQDKLLSESRDPSTVKAFSIMPSGWRKKLQEKYSNVVRGTISLGDGEDLMRDVELATRLKRRDEAVESMIKLGAIIEVKDGVERIKLENFEQVVEIFNARIKSRIADGLLAESEAIYPAVVFEPAPSGGPPYLFIRPGLDEWPDPKVYRIVLDVPEFSHYDWAEIIASGRMPVSLGRIAEHDLAHLTELFRDVDLMKATREYYRRALKTTRKWRQAIIESAAEYYVAADKLPVKYHYLRATFQTEAFSLPNLSRIEEIKLLIPEYFQKKNIKNLDAAKKLLEELPEIAFNQRVAQLIATAESVLLRQGGSQRDSYNTKKAFSDPEFSNPLRKAIRARSEAVQYSTLATIAEYHHTNLHGLINEIEYLAKAKTYVSTEEHATAHKLLVDRVARFEMGLYTGVDLRITPAQVIRDNYETVFDPSSVTGRFLGSFAIKGSLLWQSYLSPEARRGYP